MNSHDEVRNLLALAAAGALSESEQRSVDRHAAECGECARELRRWQEIGGALGRMPTPLAPAALVERTRDMVEREAAAVRESRWEAGALISVTLMSWAFAASFWAALKALGYGLDGPRILVWSAAWVLLSTLTAAVAAGALVARRRVWRSL